MAGVGLTAMIFHGFLGARVAQTGLPVVVEID
jgi:hypothetical protein